MARRFVTFVTLVLLFPGRADATTFVLISTSRGIYIGADSKRVIYGVRDESVCKVQTYQKTVMLTWGDAGRGEVKNIKTGQIVSEPVMYSSVSRPVLEMALDAKKKSEILEKRTRDYVRAGIDELVQYNFPITPVDVSRMFIGAAFVAYENGIPAVYWFEIQVTDWKTRSMSTNWTPEPAFLNRVRGVPTVLGKGEGWRAYIASNPRHIHEAAEDEAIATISDILNRQVAYSPSEVGPPFAIVLLKPDGELKWIKDGECKPPLKKEAQKNTTTK